MSSPVSYDLYADIGVITIDNPPVNALSVAVRQGLQEVVRRAQTDSSKAIVIHCEGRTFVAGADIREFGKPPQDPWLPELLDDIERSQKIVIAAIHGTALGGGFELCLASHYRIALPSARVGLPEVKLGLVPGAGGTQRTPRLAGVAAALDLIASGEPINAEAAATLGLIDKVVDGELRDAAVGYARTLVSRGAGVRRSSERPAPASDQALFAEYRRRLEQKSPGQLAPQRLVDCVEAATVLPFPHGMAKERETFLELMASEQSAGRRHVFFAERQAARIDGIDKDTPRREIHSVGVIGAGTMGTGIAMNVANAGLPVSLIEVNDDALGRGLEMIARNYAGGVKRGKLSEADAVAKRELIDGSTDFNRLGDVDLVIEAVFEDLSLKQDIFGRLDDICKDGAILATNTSYQNVDKIAAVTRCPADVIGLHFFSPAHIMKLLEVVRAEQTADDVLATCMQLAKTLRKIPVVAGVCYGFIGNRMLQHYGREAQLCLIEGATPESIDTAMQQWGMAMGPMRVFDLAGLDVGYKARHGLPEDERGDPRAYGIADALVEAGRLGQKSGAGFYTYDPDTRDYHFDADARALIEREAAALNVERRDIDASEIVDRLIYALINEGLRVVEEGIAQRPSDIDVVYVYGYGFPPHRGGPMHFADVMGLEQVRARICEFRDRFGAEHWTPAPLLEKLIRDQATVASLNG